MVDSNAMWDALYLGMPIASLEKAAMGTVEMKLHTCHFLLSNFPQSQVLTFSCRIQKKYILHQVKILILKIPYKCGAVLEEQVQTVEKTQFIDEALIFLDDNGTIHTAKRFQEWSDETQHEIKSFYGLLNCQWE